MKKFAGIFATGAMVAVLGLMPMTATAQSLSQTLKTALRSSPGILANRAALRAAEEGVVQAGAAKRPQLSATASARLGANHRTDWEATDTYNAALNASLLLFDGGQTAAAVRAARQQVEAARMQFAATVHTTLLNAITAYVDVRRDERFVSLAQNNVRVIGQQVTAAKDRFEVGEVTRTDVSQAEARLASARSNLASSRGALERSRQAYLIAVGSAPGGLSQPPRLPKMPKTEAEARAIAMRTHPQLAAARANIAAAEANLDRARAGRSLQVTLNGQVAYNRNTPIDGQHTGSANLSLNGNMPLYQGGQLDSVARQAQHVLDQRKAELQTTARQIQQQVALSWSGLRVARASIQASREEIRAARLAFEGVREEAKLGARTTLDTLDAEQSALNAETGLVAAQRDEYVAAYNLVYAMGLLSPEYLNLGMSTFDRAAPKIEGAAPAASRQGGTLDRIGSRWN